MVGLTNVKDMVDAENNGQTRYFTWRKTPTQTTTAGVWFDLSMSPGNPVPQYYAASPLVSVAFRQSTDGGLMHGDAVSPKIKYLRQTTALQSFTATPLPITMILCDYLMYYPFIDESTTDPQMLVNSVTLPRYADGLGVQVMAVSVAGRTGGQTFTINYTNSDGVSGRVSKTVIQNTVSVNGSLVTTAQSTNGGTGPFIPLQDGDKGIRSIESITMNGPDVGLFTLVLVKPLAETQIRGIDAPVEKDYFSDAAQAPIIRDDAYLNWICLPQGTLSGAPIHGDIKVIWN